jgi:Fe2+ or Zn2+ uptake regulation protein
MDQEAAEKFETFVRLHHGRLTPQRQFIVREFLALNGHYGIDELHEHLRKKGKNINPSTIFRTLKLELQWNASSQMGTPNTMSTLRTTII